MTKKILRLTKIALLICSFTFLLGSCTKETLIENPAKETQWYVQEFRIKSTAWKWDDKAKRYFADGRLDNLNFDIYKDGAVIGYVYLGKPAVNELMSVLPYRGSDRIFERIWFDVSYDLDRSVRFYYQWSDYAQIQPADQHFKITMIY